jgi:hypothetical protein
MLTVLRKIRRELVSGGKLRKYIFYAFGEIVLVVIGILIALQINSWNDRRLERLESIKVHQSVKQQISEDREALMDMKQYNGERSKAYKHANQIIAEKDFSRVDSLAMIAMSLAQYSDFHRDASAYKNLATSGQIEYISNPEITNTLQHLDLSYTFINNLESMHWDMIIHNLSPELRSVVNYNTFKPVLPERLYGVELQNIFVESIYLTAYKDYAYGRAVSEIDSLIRMIDNEIGTN